MNTSTYVATGVRVNLEQLEQEAQAIARGPYLEPDKGRELRRIQERIRELREQLELISRKPN